MAYDYRDSDRLNVDIFKGTAGKHVLFQPRIDCWYYDKLFLGQPLPGGLEGCTVSEMYRRLGVTNRIYNYTQCFERVYDASVKIETKELSPMETLTRVITPVGELTSVMRANDSNPGRFYSKWLVETPEDIRVKIYTEEATHWRYHPEMFDAVRKEWRGLGAPTMYMFRTTIQECFVETMGVENTIYALTDEQELMERYFAALTAGQESWMDAIIESPIEIINYGDNLHAGILSPAYFERYVQPVYLHRRDRLKPHGKFLHSHWDGDLRALLPYVSACGLDGIEAMTPAPQGDVTVDEIIEALGDHTVLLDGIAAILFQNTYPVEQLLAQVERLIQGLAGRLILGISDEMPSFGDIERVRLVRDYVAAYNQKISSVTR